ncbi:MAG: LytR C-terminal domain-containing protein [Elusimicrobiota bacterium]|jgi:hypothetical protein|nr:LytR C-terminal domain-containing protein [Elusimicrobiota bacterium]
MEHFDFKKQIKLRLVLYFASFVFLYGILAHFYNPLALTFNLRKDKPVNIIVLTDEPVFIAYNPHYKKALVTNLPKNGKNTNLNDMLKEAGVNDIVYISPNIKDRNLFWNNFKNALNDWPYKPYIIIGYIYNYVKMRITKKTDIAPSDFIMISMDLTGLKPSDFSVKNQRVNKANQRLNRRRAPAPRENIVLEQNIAPMPNTSKALVVEIFNASGRDGLAAALTRYLRDLSNRGILNVDVINYANNPLMQDRSEISDITGRLGEIKKMADLLGLSNNEIIGITDRNAISDAKITLGKDFVMPKPQK